MHNETMSEKIAQAKARYAYAHEARGRGLKKNWFVAMVALWIVIWAFVGTSGLIPRPLWVAILLSLLIAEFAIALFAPRINQQKPH